MERGGDTTTRKGEKVGERIVALLSTNRWQTCVHQRAAYRPPLTCQPPRVHIVKYGSWRCTTPHLDRRTPPFTSVSTPATPFAALLRIRNTRVALSSFFFAFSSSYFIIFELFYLDKVLWLLALDSFAMVVDLSQVPNTFSRYSRKDVCANV